MDTFSAVPAFRRLPITIIDRSRYNEWLNSPIEQNLPVPTITEIFIGYEKGGSTPTTVQVEVDKVDTEYSQNLPTDEEQKTLTPFELGDKWRRLNMLLRRNLLLAVIRGLDVDDASNLATDKPDGSLGDGHKILVMLGWLESRPLDKEEEVESEHDMENKEEGEVTKVDETGE